MLGKTTDELKVGRERHTGLDGNNEQGYYGGGRTNVVSTTILKSLEKMHFPSDSTVALYVELTAGRINAGGLNEGSSKGYFAGGNTAASTTATTNSLETLHYLTDTFTSVATTLSSARTNMACLSHVYVPTDIVPTALNILDTAGFVPANNGYEMPNEAYMADGAQQFSISYNGYEVPSEFNPMPPTPNNDFQKSMNDVFRTVKVRLKDDQILPNLVDLMDD